MGRRGRRFDRMATKWRRLLASFLPLSGLSLAIAGRLLGLPRPDHPSLRLHRCGRRRRCSGGRRKNLGVWAQKFGWERSLGLAIRNDRSGPEGEWRLSGAERVKLTLLQKGASAATDPERSFDDFQNEHPPRCGYSF
ncbi:exported hypothetical protein [Magnetospirillum sp. SS-4]|nr:exported hypothetical protein [Magnetospirillum sp. SS-4]